MTFYERIQKQVRESFNFFFMPPKILAYIFLICSLFFAAMSSESSLTRIETLLLLSLAVNTVGFFSVLFFMVEDRGKKK